MKRLVSVNLYPLPKIGFRNCKARVADDAERDHVGDIGLVAEKGQQYPRFTVYICRPDALI